MDGSHDPAEPMAPADGGKERPDTVDVVEGPVGSASLKEPSDVIPAARRQDGWPKIEEDDADSADRTDRPQG